MHDYFKTYGKVIAVTVIINLLVTIGLLSLLLPEAIPTSVSESLSNSTFSTESNIVRIVEEANPAVISIVITKNVPIYEEFYGGLFPFNFFGFPFDFREPSQQGTEELEVGGGSGFIVSSEGLVVTNKHVVSDTDASYTAFTNTGDRYELDLIARDPFIDIAILKMRNASNMPYLTFGNSSDLKLGETVVAIGNALNEFRNSVSVGVISGLSRSVIAGTGFGNQEELREVIQTDAAINPGNSGGPLLNAQGNVIGVNVAVALGSENIGFALPANTVKQIVDSVEEHGRIVHPYLGVRYIVVTPELIETNNLAVDHGVLVSAGGAPNTLAVIPGSPADKAGLVENDIILEVDGEKITEEYTLSDAISKKRVGDTARLRIYHRGNVTEKTVTLEEAPQNIGE